MAWYHSLFSKCVFSLEIGTKRQATKESNEGPVLSNFETRLLIIRNDMTHFFSRKVYPQPNVRKLQIAAHG